MHAFLLQAAPKGEDAYEFFTFGGPRPVPLNFRGVIRTVNKGDRFGVRPSSNKKFIRLIFPGEPTKVYTIDMQTAKQLAKGIVSERR